MKINLSPQCRRETNFSLSKAGDKLTINGQEFDLSVIPEGATLPNAAKATSCNLFSGSISRTSGELELTLILPLADDEKRQSCLYPKPITVADDGPISLPTEGANGN